MIRVRFVLTAILSFAVATVACGLGNHRLHAQEKAIRWFDNYSEALAEARRTKQPIFLEFRCAP